MNTRRAVNDLAQYRRRKGITQETIARRMGRMQTSRHTPRKRTKPHTQHRHTHRIRTGATRATHHRGRNVKQGGRNTRKPLRDKVKWHNRRWMMEELA